MNSRLGCAPLLQGRQHGIGKSDMMQQVRLEALGPGSLSGPGRAGGDIGDRQIQTAQLCDGLTGPGLEGFAITHIHGGADSRAAVFLQGAHRRLHARCRAGADAHRAALGHKAPGNGKADPPARPRDDGPLALQSQVHCSLPPVLPSQHAAIDWHRDSGDERCGRAAEPEHGLGDFLGRPVPAHW